MTENKMIQVALVDDHILIRDAIAAVINGFGSCRVTILARHGKELIEKLQPGNLPDLVLLDINMPEMDGFETAKWLSENHPAIRVLVLTMYDSELALIRLIQAGARGFLKKDIHPGELKTAIETTFGTGYYYLNHFAGALLDYVKHSDQNGGSKRAIHLTENELTFLKLAATDMTYKEIAMHMNISPRTIDNYRDSLFLKLDVKSRVGLVLYAVKNGVIRPGY